jgi:peptide/nickel transport system substrate-binding protein
MTASRRRRLRAAVLCLALVAVACSGDDDDESAGDGSAVLGVEQYPECLNPVTSCGSLQWMHWAFAGQVLPRLMELDPNNDYVPSPVLDGDPEVSGDGTGNGSGPFKVTYDIADDAQWDDGSAITSADVAFTWRAYLETTSSVKAGEYGVIQSIDSTDDGQAVVTFKQPYAPWPELFGGVNGYVLKKAAFGDTNLEGEMATTIPFSGGPFKLDSFSSTEGVLVANDRYWDGDRKPEIGRVTLVPKSSDNGPTALVQEEVDAIYPQPAPGLLDALDHDGVATRFGLGTRIEGMFFAQKSQKNKDTVLADATVRQALLFAIDREAILEEVIRPEFPEADYLDCAMWAPTVGQWCDEDDYADVEYDTRRVASILEPAGWRKGTDGIYARDGRRLSITWQTDSTSKRRTDIQSLLIPKARAAGVELVPDDADLPTLGPRIGKADFEILMLNQTLSPDPSVTTQWSCDQVATPENGFAGDNVFGWCNQEATEAMVKSDRTSDVDDRVALIHKVGDLMRKDAVMLPLYQLPLTTAWSSDKFTGPVGEYTSSPNGAYANLYDWSLKRS